LIDVLATGREFNVVYRVTEILPPLSKRHSGSAKGDKRKPIIRSDNASLHPAHLSAEFFEHNRMKTASHPLYSPDRAPSDFYLFESARELLEIVQGVLEGVGRGPCGRSFSSGWTG
jgi:hypothetical protein